MLRQVLDAIVFLAMIAAPAWALLRVAWRWRTRRPVSIGREALFALGVLYMVVLAAVTVYPLPASRHPDDRVRSMNVVPFVSPIRCLEPTQLASRAMRSFCARNIAGNLALFMPVGFLLPLYLPSRAGLGSVAVAALLLSVAIEGTQYAEFALGISRTVDVDDVILNVAGACLGFRVWWVWVRRDA